MGLMIVRILSWHIGTGSFDGSPILLSHPSDSDDNANVQYNISEKDNNEF